MDKEEESPYPVYQIYPEVIEENTGKVCRLICSPQFNRFPEVNPAGVRKCFSESVWDCMRWKVTAPKMCTTLEERVRIARDLKLAEVQPIPEQCIYPTPGEGGSMAEIVSPQPLTDFQNLNLTRREAIYARSRMPLGKVRDASLNLPKDMNPEKETFGKVVERSPPAGPIVNPRKSHPQVVEESRVAHDMYVKSHKDYQAAEQRRRGYNERFDPQQMFGKPTGVEFTGRVTKCCFDYSDVLKPKEILARQAEFLKHTKPRIGKPSTKIRPPIVIDESKESGPVHRNVYGMEDFLGLRPPGRRPVPEHELWFLANKIRMRLDKRHYSIQDFEDMIRFYDKDNIGILKLSDFAKVCGQLGVAVEPHLLPSIMEACDNCLDQGCGTMCYPKFIKFMSWEETPPALAKLTQESILQPAVEGQDTSFVSSYRCAFMDFHDKAYEKAEMRPLGVPTIRTDLGAPRVRKVSDSTNYGDQLDAKSLISPSIYTVMGVGPEDFFKPRTSDDIRALWRSIGVDMSDDVFYQTYAEAARRDPWGEDKVCLETFRNVMDEMEANRFHQSRVLSLDATPNFPYQCPPYLAVTAPCHIPSQIPAVGEGVDTQQYTKGHKCNLLP